MIISSRVVPVFMLWWPIFLDYTVVIIDYLVMYYSKYNLSTNSIIVLQNAKKTCLHQQHAWYIPAVRCH